MIFFISQEKSNYFKLVPKSLKIKAFTSLGLILESRSLERNVSTCTSMTGKNLHMIGYRTDALPNRGLCSTSQRSEMFELQILLKIISN